jgi:hypothetical protein
MNENIEYELYTIAIPTNNLILQEKFADLINSCENAFGGAALIEVSSPQELAEKLNKFYLAILTEGGTVL